MNKDMVKPGLSLSTALGNESRLMKKYLSAIKRPFVKNIVKFERKGKRFDY